MFNKCLHQVVCPLQHNNTLQNEHINGTLNVCHLLNWFWQQRSSALIYVSINTNRQVGFLFVTVIMSFCSSKSVLAANSDKTFCDSGPETVPKGNKTKNSKSSCQSDAWRSAARSVHKNRFRATQRTSLTATAGQAPSSGTVLFEKRCVCWCSGQQVWKLPHTSVITSF